MACSNNLVFLGCEYSGVGYTARPVEKDATHIQLMRGHGNNFPTLVGGSHFYITVEGCNSCCETMKVVGRDGDVLHVVRGYGDACSCISSNASVMYTTDVKPFFDDINSVIPLNVQSPLAFDCKTNTLSIDCAELFKSGCGGGCDCGEGCEDTGVQPVTGGLRGERGPQGEPGPSVTGITVSATGKIAFSFSDGSTVVAEGSLPKGAKGDKGDKGDAGAKSPVLLSGAMDGEDLVLTFDDDSTITVEKVKGAKGDTGEQGEQGATGPQGVKGDKGDGACYMVFASNSWYVYGTASTAHAIQYSGMNIPFTTDADGIAELNLSLIQKGSLVRILRDSKVVGIGVV